MDENMNTVHYAYEDVTYSDDGHILQRTFYKEDGTIGLIRTFDDETHEQTGYSVLSNGGNIGLNIDFGRDGGYSLSDYNEYGKAKNKYKITNDEYKIIQKRNLLNYPQFTAGNIKVLSKLDDTAWEKVEKFIETHENAAFEDIRHYLASFGTMI